MRVWVTADELLEHAGAYADPSAASSADRTWAELCAAAASAGLNERLAGTVWVDPPIEPPADPPAELAWCARTAGQEAYKRREAVGGITGYVDLAGAAVRLARDYLESVAPIIARYATKGLA